MPKSHKYRIHKFSRNRSNWSIWIPDYELKGKDGNNDNGNREEGKDNKAFRKVMINMSSYTTAAHNPDLGVTNKLQAFPIVTSCTPLWPIYSGHLILWPPYFSTSQDLYFRSHSSHPFDVLLPSDTSLEFFVQVLCSSRSMRWV